MPWLLIVFPNESVGVSQHLAAIGRLPNTVVAIGWLLYDVGFNGRLLYSVRLCVWYTGQTRINHS